MVITGPCSIHDPIAVLEYADRLQQLQEQVKQEHKIQYPNYTSYKNSAIMMSEIMKQNSEILNFGMINNCKWEYFTSTWVNDNFGQNIEVKTVFNDILITLIK